MNYIALKNNIFNLDSYQIVPLRQSDIFLIKQWRNEQISVLRQNQLLTDQDQTAYYENQVIPTFSQLHPKMLLFSYLQQNVCIGYGGLTHIDWESKRTELSFLMNTQRYYDDAKYAVDFSHFISLMKQVAFRELKLNRIFTETFDIRAWHISILEKNGFRLEGRMKQHVYIENRFVDSLLHGLLKEYENL